MHIYVSFLSFYQALVELLCNVKEMEEAVVEMKYDTKKAPLGMNVFKTEYEKYHSVIPFKISSSESDEFFHL